MASTYKSLKSVISSGNYSKVEELLAGKDLVVDSSKILSMSSTKESPIIDLQSFSEEEQYDLLSTTIELKHRSIVQLLLENGLETNYAAVEAKKVPLLCKAVKAGDEEIVKLLLLYNARVNARQSRKYVKKIRKRRNFEPLPFTKGSTALHYAAAGGNENLVKLLLTWGANVFTSCVDEVGALTHAAQRGHLSIVKMLLDRKDVLNSVECEGNSPLTYAAEFGHKDVVMLLLSCLTREVEGTMTAAFHYAVKGGHLEIAKIFLNRGVSIDDEDNNHNCETALNHAAQYGHLEIVKFLLEKGAGIHYDTGLMPTSLYRAAEEGYSDIVDLLLEYDFNLEEIDSAVFRAVVCEHEDVAKILLSHEIMCTCEFFVSQKDANGAISVHLISPTFIKTYLPSLVAFYFDCFVELVKIYKEKFPDTTVHIYDVLIGKSLNELAGYARNENIVSFLSTEKLELEFPCYGSSIAKNLRKGVERNNLFDTAETVYQSLYKKHTFELLPKLPITCTRIIMSFLENKDLVNFIGVFQPFQ